MGLENHVEILWGGVEECCASPRASLTLPRIYLTP